MKFLLTLISTLLFCTLLSAQNSLVFTNAQKINETRYSDYKGSPYLFEDWMTGNIYDSNGKVFEKVQLNFNGYTNEIEIKNKDEYIVLDKRDTLKSRWKLRME